MTRIIYHRLPDLASVASFSDSEQRTPSEMRRNLIPIRRNRHFQNNLLVWCMRNKRSMNVCCAYALIMSVGLSDRLPQAVYCGSRSHDPFPCLFLCRHRSRNRGRIRKTGVRYPSFPPYCILPFRVRSSDLHPSDLFCHHLAW